MATAATSLASTRKTTSWLLFRSLCREHAEAARVSSDGPRELVVGDFQPLFWCHMTTQQILAFSVIAIMMAVSFGIVFATMSWLVAVWSLR
ncbi:hypothetical protein ABIA24_005465 [Sinorhizobium fredii]